MFDMLYENVYSQFMCGIFSGSREIERDSEQDEKLRMCHVADGMRCLRLVGSLKLQVSFAKEPYKRDYIKETRSCGCVMFQMLWGGYD